MPNLRIALVDDHPIFREGLRSLLERQKDFKVVAEASSARQAYPMIESIRPDLVVLDITLPGVDGFSATRELKRRAPEGKVLILSVHAREEYAAQAIEAGATGYAMKSQPSEEVIDAVRTVGRGSAYLPPAFSQAVLTRSRSKNDHPLDALSSREHEVFELLVRGFTNQLVGKELGISVKTVETHRSRIHRKLSLHSVAELIRFAALNGLIRD